MSEKPTDRPTHAGPWWCRDVLGNVRLIEVKDAVFWHDRGGQWLPAEPHGFPPAEPDLCVHGFKSSTCLHCLNGALHARAAELEDLQIEFDAAMETLRSAQQTHLSFQARIDELEADAAKWRERVATLEDEIEQLFGQLSLALEGSNRAVRERDEARAALAANRQAWPRRFEAVRDGDTRHGVYTDTGIYCIGWNSYTIAGLRKSGWTITRWLDDPPEEDGDA